MILIFFLFVLGIVFGSFISALTWRYPRHISICEGRSFCDKCHNKIGWFDNIPLISYIFLLGKCRHCKTHISFRYPLIELSTGISFLLIYTLQGGSFQGAYSLVLFLILETIFIIDLEHQIIPDSFVFAGIGFIFLVDLMIKPALLIPDLFAGLIVAVFLLTIHLLTFGRGMGLGDVKFAVLGGLIIGAKLTFIWVLLAFLTGGVVGAILILLKKAKLKSKIAFGPFLVVGLILAYLFGDKIRIFIGF